MLFVYFKQAFNSVLRIKVIEEMRKIEVLEKIMRLVVMTMRSSQGRVYTADGMTNAIDMKRGVSQGDELSAVLYNIVWSDTTGRNGKRYNNKLNTNYIVICR